MISRRGGLSSESSGRHNSLHCSSIRYSNLSGNGEVAEWSNAAVSKTVIRGNADPGFKSLPLRFYMLGFE